MKKDNPKIDSRDIVLSVLMDMEDNGTFSNIALTKALQKNQFSEKQERAFITRLAEGTVEYQITLDYVLDQFSKTKMKKCKPMIRCLLRMGAYQILFMDRVPDSAACNEAVRLAKKHGFGGLSGFVNGVLRNVARKKDYIEYPSEADNPAEYLSVKYSIPKWLCEKLLTDYPKQAKGIMEGSFSKRKTTLRVNTGKITRDDLKKMLLDAGVSVQNGNYDDKALLIDEYDFIRKLPGYRQGFFTVQDESSMCAIRAAGIKKGDKILDVCAAPGGKTTAAAEYMEGVGTICAMDLSEEKLELIEENVNRLDFPEEIRISISAHDATDFLEEMKEQMDVVIADLPCSGLGIIGRKNDIKYRLTKEQLSELSDLQKRILDTVYDYVKPGGTLLYSTCTINPDENEENTKWFLKKQPEFSLESERLFLQGVDSCDGFYYAVFKRG